jgi:hypothetical protein
VAAGQRYLASLCQLCQLIYAVCAGSVSGPGRCVNAATRGLTGSEVPAVNHFEATVARLEADFPDWQCWYVPLALGGTTWCARRWDGTGEVLNADSPDELADYLAAGGTG